MGQSIDVFFKLEVRGYMGDVEALYTKEVKMPAAPTVGLKIIQEDMILTVDELYYHIDDGYYIALIIYQSSNESWDFLKKLSWSKEVDKWELTFAK